MYKGAQNKQDWMARVGSHSTREHLSANLISYASFERGALPELKDDVARWRIQAAGLPQNSQPERMLRAKIKNAEADIKRLNREASETHERALLYKALQNVLPEIWLNKVNEEARRLRLLAVGESNHD